MAKTYPGVCAYCGCGFVERPLNQGNFLFCGVEHYERWVADNMTSKEDQEVRSHGPKASPTASQSVIINGLPLSVSPTTSDILAAVHFGFAQAVEMFKVVTQPSAPASDASKLAVFREEGEEEILAAGFIDVNSLWAMTPVQREAVLSQYGLQVAIEPEPAPDPVHAEVAAATGLKSLGEDEGD
uniref:Uncharacterized protein n=2 Tax=viral metagenome TaxID=1070528 RepID=A0A6M3Y0B2_9ZZZZ